MVNKKLKKIYKRISGNFRKNQGRGRRIMGKEKVFEIEFQPVFDKWAWKITKQNEEILERNNFKDEELNVESFRSPEFLTLKNKLFIRGNEKRWDDNISICNQEEKTLTEEKVKAINQKYGIKKRWRAEKKEIHFCINENFETSWFREYHDQSSNKKYKNGNYFKTEVEAEEYAKYIKKCSLEWHEMRDNNE